jgi:hypothetical protein
MVFGIMETREIKGEPYHLPVPIAGKVVLSELDSFINDGGTVAVNLVEPGGNLVRRQGLFFGNFPHGHRAVQIISYRY